MRNINNYIQSHSFVFSKLSFLRNRKRQEDTVDPVDPVDFLPFQLDSNDSSEIDEINNLFRELTEYADYVSVFLHGSWADNTTTPFSDIDDFVIIDLEKSKRDGVLESITRILYSIDMAFCRRDPLQHHGHWGCFVDDLDCFDDSFMPINVVRNSKIVLGRKSYCGNIDAKKSAIGLRRNIRTTCDNIERLAKMFFDNKINAYDLKCLVGSFALMPAFIFQVNGQDLDKRTSIGKAQVFFSKDSMYCLEWATNCRDNWGLITTSYKFKIFSFARHFFRDPFLWRFFTRKCSPRIKPDIFYKLSSSELRHEYVSSFISDAKRHV